MVLKSVSCIVSVGTQEDLCIYVSPVEKGASLAAVKNIQTQVNAFLTEKINSSSTPSDNGNDEQDEELDESDNE